MTLAGTATLVPARVDQIPLIQHYLGQLAQQDGVRPNATDDFLRNTLFGDAPSAFANLVEVDGQHRGITVHSWKWGAFSGTLDMYLHVLVLAPESRGKGVGRAAMRGLLELARTRGASRLELMAVRENSAAAAFYAAEGLVEMTRMTVWRKPV